MVMDMVGARKCQNRRFLGRRRKREQVVIEIRFSILLVRMR